MKILICPDSFKGSLSASEAAAAMASGVRRAYPDAEIVELPLADGGEGTVDALVNATGGEFVEVNVRDPLMRWIPATFGILGDGKTAVVEMASAAGLSLLTEEERNPLVTSTYGVGQLLLSATHANVKSIIVGIGDSATNDGGAGMAQAMGARLLDSKGNGLPPGGAALQHLYCITMSGFIFPRDTVSVQVACDVDNPLTGANGASAVYGPQKGADPDKVRLLDLALQNYARILERDLGVAVADLPGAGAAGGLGAGLVAFLGAELVSGIDMIMEAVNFDQKLAGADIVVTGEGRMDSQTLRGKTITGVLKRAQAYGLPVVAVGGSVQNRSELHGIGLRVVHSLTGNGIKPEEAIERAQELLEEKTFEALRDIGVQ